MNTRDETLQINQILDGRYRIVADQVPQDIGITCKAYDMQHDRLVVVLLPQSPERDPLPLDALKRSQQAVADLAQPSLIPYDQVGISQGQLYLVRHHVEGQTLADLLQHAGTLGHDATVDIAIRLCDVLSPAHRAGIVHGGLSPQSVLIADDGRVMLTDTGLIPALRPLSAPPGSPWGRFPYLSPEQAAGDGVHPSSDVYIIGLLLYEMLAGRPPFYNADKVSLALQHLRQTPTYLLSLAPRVPQSLAQIVHKSLAKEPAVRYRNAGQVATILHSQTLRAAVELPQVSDDTLETADLQPTPAKESLVVPPPPSGPAAQDPYYHAQTGIWVDEPAGADWLMIALIIAALISVLGLIPLWSSVHRRYTTPPPGSRAYSYSLAGNLIAQSQPFFEKREGCDCRMAMTDILDLSGAGLVSRGSLQRQYFCLVLSEIVGVQPWQGPAGPSQARSWVWESRLRL